MSQHEQEMLFPVEAVKNQGWTKMKNQGLKSRQGSETEKTKGRIVTKGVKKEKPRA